MGGTTLEGRGLPPYRGEDRRRIAAAVRMTWHRHVGAGVLGLLAAALLIIVALPLPLTRATDALLITDMLAMTSLVLALAASAMAVARWRLNGDAAAMWIAAALFVFAVVRLGIVELLPVIVAGEPVSVLAGWLRPAGLLVTAGLLAVAAIAPPVDSRLRPSRVCAAAAGAVALVAAVTGFFPELAGLLDGVQGREAGSHTATSTIGVMPLLWLIGSGTFVWIGRRRQGWLFTGCGLLLLALALAEVIRVAAPGPAAGGLLGLQLVRLLGLGIALSDATREVLLTYREASRSLVGLSYQAATATERMRADAAATEERAHEAGSALAAIEGATLTLERHRERLDPRTQRALSAGVRTEIRRLRHLVGNHADDATATPLALAAVLEPLLATEKARGTELTVAIPAELTVLGRGHQVEQIVHTLLDNARRYAPGSPVTLRAQLDGDQVVLRVEDRGPGIAAQQRLLIFRRGVRGDAPADVPGSGLGLYIATQLLRTQAGELWVEQREGGGASFALALPCGSGPSGSGCDSTAKPSGSAAPIGVARGMPVVPI